MDEKYIPGKGDTVRNGREKMRKKMCVTTSKSVLIKSRRLWGLKLEKLYPDNGWSHVPS